jgi:hypothetical protein
MTTADLLSRITKRLGDDPTTPLQSYYTRGEVLVALNQAYRMMVFFTLCLETTVTYNFLNATAFYSMLTTYGDWILPLRIRLVGGAKLRPNKVTELAALDASWSTTAGTPERYALLGFDLVCLYKRPTGTTAASIVYARTPTPLSADTDVPELQTEYHDVLIDGAISILRIKEGAQEWQKTLTGWARFMEAIAKLAEYVRARNRAQGYDHEPVELARFDRSTLEANCGK